MQKTASQIADEVLLKISEPDPQALQSELDFRKSRGAGDAATALSTAVGTGGGFMAGSRLANLLKNKVPAKYRWAPAVAGGILGAGAGGLGAYKATTALNDRRMEALNGQLEGAE